MMEQKFEWGMRIQDFVKPVLEYFSMEGFAPLLALGLLIGAFFFALYMYVKHIHLARKALRAALDVVRVIENQDGFKEKYDFVDEGFKKIPLLSRGWDEFAETLVFPSEHDAVRVIRNTIRPSYYLNIAEVESAIKLRRIHSWANVFVGVGLLLTFIGLVAALTKAGVAVNDAGGDIQTPIKELLRTASFKFWTSVAGLGSSISLKIFYEFFHGNLKKKLSKINNKLELGLQFVTPEGLAIEQLREAKEQTVAMKKFSTDLAVSMAKELHPVFQGVMAPVATSIDGLRDKLTNGIGEVVSSTVGPEMKGLVQTITDITITLGGFKTQFEGIVGSIKESIEGATLALSSSSNEVMEKMLHRVSDSLSDMAKKDQERVALLDTTVKNLSDSLAQSKSEMDGMGANVSHAIADATSSMTNSAIEAVQNMAEQMNDVLKRMHDNTESHSKHIQKTVDVIMDKTGAASEAAGGQIQQAAEKMSDSLLHVSEAMNVSLMQMTKKLDDLGVSIQNIEGRVNNHISSMTSLTNRIEETEKVMSETSQHLSDAAQPLIKSNQSVVTTLSGMKEHVDSVQKVIVSSHEDLNKLSESMQAAQEKLQVVWSQYDNRFSNVDESMGRALTSIITHVNDTVKSLDELYRNMDEKFGQAVSNLGANIHALGENAEEFEDAAAKLLQATNTLSERI